LRARCLCCRKCAAILAPSDPQRGIKIDTDGTVTNVTWTRETVLTAIQDAVGGTIEMVALPTYGLRLVCNEEAKLHNDWPQRINRHATDLYSRECSIDLFAPDRIWDRIAGSVLVISERVGPEGESIGLSSCGLSDLRCWLATGHLELESHGVR